MFIRFKTGTAEAPNEVNVVVNNIATFAPNSAGDGSVIYLVNGNNFAVNDSCRSIRSAIKKLCAVDTEKEEQA